MWPQSTMAKLKTFDDTNTDFVIQHTTVPYARALYDLNYVNSPIDAGTAQPAGIDVFNLAYRAYKVMGVKITAEFNLDPIAQENCVVGMLMLGHNASMNPIGTSSGWTNVAEWFQENPHAISKTLTPFQKVNLTMYRSCGRLFGNSKEYSSDLSYNGALPNGNPTIGLRGAIFAWTLDGNLPTDDIHVYSKIIITQYYKFFDRRLKSSQQDQLMFSRDIVVQDNMPQ